MYRRNPKDTPQNAPKDEVCGVLNDFDLAKQADDPSPSSHEITGTVPCMALDLLRDPAAHDPHLYRHDLESFGWAFLLVASEEFDSAGNITRHEKLKSWYTSDRDSNLTAKQSLLYALEKSIDDGTLPLGARHQGDKTVSRALADVLRWIDETDRTPRKRRVESEERDRESYRTVMAALGFEEAKED
jgi:hypothetical protein